MTREDSNSGGSGWFPTTAWSFIQLVQDRQREEYLPELQRFAKSYLKPVFCFIRTRGYSHHRAEELTQEFFLRLMEREWLTKADPMRGKFRTFLLTVLTRFLSDMAAGRAPLQIVFDGRMVSNYVEQGTAELSYEPTVNETPESVFMREWAVALVAGALQRLRQFYEEQDNATWYEIFSARHALTDIEDPATQDVLGARYGMTRDRVRYALEMTQKRFAHFLREEVRDQVGSGADIDAEVRELLALLGQ